MNEALLQAMPGVERGCGKSRTPGALYLECGVGSTGRPLDAFLVDPPVPVSPLDDGVRSLGVELVEDEDGIVHVLDWVGQVHYPYAVDFIEEARRKGFSRRVSRLTELHLLTPLKSRLYFIHARGMVTNWEDFESGVRGRCAQQLNALPEAHESGPCSKHLWRAFAADDPQLGQGERVFTDFRYAVEPGNPPAAGAFQPALFMSVPITSMCIIEAADGSHRGLLKDVKSRAPGFFVGTQAR